MIPWGFIKQLYHTMYLLFILISLFWPPFLIPSWSPLSVFPFPTLYHLHPAIPLWDQTPIFPAMIPSCFLGYFMLYTYIWRFVARKHRWEAACGICFSASHSVYFALLPQYQHFYDFFYTSIVFFCVKFCYSFTIEWYIACFYFLIIWIGQQ